MITVEAVESAIGPLDGWAQNCHGASLALLRSNVLDGDWRMARGVCEGVTSQHSWLVRGDPYEQNPVLDVTAWSYAPRPRVWAGLNGLTHLPHGWGTLWEHGRPVRGNGADLELDVQDPAGKEFLRTTFPDGLDVQGLHRLLQAPVHGWPAAAVYEAVRARADLRGLVRIDVAAMLTGENIGGLYR